MEAPHFIFAGGGTGGHLYPGLAVAAALRRRVPAAAITFLTTSRQLDRDLLSKTDYSQVPQSVRPFSTRPWHWPAFYLAWRGSVSAARSSMLERRPAAVIGLGGYAAGPAVVAGRALGVRTAILNPDAVPGRANRFLARRCDLVAMQWDASRRHFPLSSPCRTLGCPIREEFSRATRADGCRRFELDAARPVLLVTGASQGARTINFALTRAWPRFASDHSDWQLLHLTGAADEAEVRAAYSAARVEARVQAYTHEMAWAIAAADVIVSRAGASTLAELTALGKPAVLLPYPFHRDRHQHANAEVLAAEGAAVIVEDAKDAAANEQPLLAALRRLADRATRELMAVAARRLGRLNAADDVAAWMIEGGRIRV